ncbi:hypothetical protein [Anaerosalibacter sp. Marseille-P3206]|uniref:hypothetical protein n=1 Tax=Anaerosalibacter sp. Marseille-P3206 TaxID=1871005 RepID=UPI000986AE13|nr:hypothetical protein [Anaerosalibacter sp. Marseille-P3206]
MKQRRVGTISMAIVLIAVGIIMLVSQINDVSAVKLSMKFWPAVLFLLGGEILWYSYKYNDEDIKIKYDVFSVFIVLLIVGINLCFYGLMETGLMSRITSKVSSQTYTYKLPYKEVELGNEIEKIVVNSPSGTNLTIRTEGSNKIVSSGSINVTADREEKAKEFLNNEYIITNVSDNIMYISFMDRSNYDDSIYYAHPYDYELILPENKKVEINGGDNLKLITSSIKSDWVIDNVNRIRLRMGKDLNVKVKTLVDSREMLRGNAKWNITEEKSGEEIVNVTGELMYGDGKSNINILNSGEIVVDEL